MSKPAMGRKDHRALIQKPGAAQSLRSYSSLKALSMKPFRVAGEDKLPDISDQAVHVAGSTFMSRYPTGAGAGGALAYGRGTGTEAAANRRTTVSWTRWPAIDTLPNNKTPPRTPPPTRHPPLAY